MNRITSFNDWTSLNEAKTVSPDNTVSFRNGEIGLYSNSMVDHLGSHVSHIKDGRSEDAQMWAVVGFNDVLMNGKPFALVTGFDGRGDASEEGRELLFMSTDKNEVEKRFKAGAKSTGYASIAWGEIKWSKFTDQSISVEAIGINMGVVKI